MSVVELQFEYRLSSALYSSSRTSILLRVSFRNRALGVEKGAAHELKPSPFYFQYTGSVFRSDSDIPSVSQPFRLAYTHFTSQAYPGVPSDPDREPGIPTLARFQARPDSLLISAVNKRHVLELETCSFDSWRVNQKAQWRWRTKTPSVPKTSAATMLIESRLARFKSLGRKKKLGLAEDLLPQYNQSPAPATANTVAQAWFCSPPILRSRLATGKPSTGTGYGQDQCPVPSVIHRGSARSRSNKGGAGCKSILTASQIHKYPCTSKREPARTRLRKYCACWTVEQADALTARPPKSGEGRGRGWPVLFHRGALRRWCAIRDVRVWDRRVKVGDVRACTTIRMHPWWILSSEVWRGATTIGMHPEREREEAHPEQGALWRTIRQLRVHTGSTEPSQVQQVDVLGVVGHVPGPEDVVVKRKVACGGDLARARSPAPGAVLTRASPGAGGQLQAWAPWDWSRTPQHGHAKQRCPRAEKTASVIRGQHTQGECAWKWARNVANESEGAMRRAA
ncbi:hypothetical protein B0H14DRAFT_3170304 [Mycena olivaceomarginata]|nr:hypothetical protein B0H14DRAFT_3170304 [Mycena olivaceomarginata]